MLVGTVNRNNVHIWESENFHMIREQIRISPKINMWCVLLHDKISTDGYNIGFKRYSNI